MDLPKEIIGQIVINLPLKYMVRFSCVSKSWQSEVSLILDARSRKVFALSKCKQKLSRTRVLIHGQKPLEILTSSDDDKYNILWYYPVEIVGSCNGLICAVVLTVGASPWQQNKIILWNPATEKFKELPPSLENEDMIKYVSSTQYGFGYDASKDDYKVVESSFVRCENWLKIYSLNSDSWRTVSTNASPITGKLDTFGVFVNDSIHWQTSAGFPEICKNFDIVAVNLITETCTIMSAPTGRDSSGHESLGVSEDRLCLSYWNSWKVNYIDYWIMEEYGVERSWTKIIRVQLDQRQRHPGGKQAMLFKVPEYDEDSGKSRDEWSVEKVCQFDEIPSSIDYVMFQCATYSESLVSVSSRVKA